MDSQGANRVVYCMRWSDARNLSTKVLLGCLFVLVLAACDRSSPNVAQQTPATTPSSVPGTGVPSKDTPGTVATSTPSPKGGTALQAQVTSFQVWQDFMPIVPPSGPPLHATLTITVNDSGRFTPANASGTITITRPGGEVIAKAPLTLAQQADDLGMAQPGPQSLTFAMAATSISATLTENEPVAGEAAITLRQDQFSVKLPETNVMFTH